MSFMYAGRGERGEPQMKGKRGGPGNSPSQEKSNEKRPECFKCGGKKRIPNRGMAGRVEKKLQLTNDWEESHLVKEVSPVYTERIKN